MPRSRAGDGGVAWRARRRAVTLVRDGAGATFRTAELRERRGAFAVRTRRGDHPGRIARGGAVDRDAIRPATGGDQRREHTRSGPDRHGRAGAGLSRSDPAASPRDPHHRLLPHLSARLMAFVLLPFLDVAPPWVHPRTGQTESALLAQVGTAR